MITRMKGREKKKSHQESHREWRQCGCKKRYKDEHAANKYRKIFENERGIKLDYYWCCYCNGFHLTSSEATYGKYELAYLAQNAM